MKENIYKRKDGRYEGRCQIGIGENGKKKYKSVYGKTKKEVRQKLAKVKTEQVETDFDMTFEQAARKWLEGQSKCRATTLSTYTSMVEGYIIPILKNYTLIQIDVSVKQEFIEKLKEQKFKESSIRSYVQVLDRIVKYNTTNDQLDYGEFDDKQKSTGVDILSEIDWRRLKAYVTTDINPMKIGVACICFLGLRVGEICALKWENVDFEERTVTVERTIERVKSQKGEKNSTRLAIMDIEPRKIPIPDTFFKTLFENRCKRDNYFVTTCSTKMKEPRTFQYSLRGLLDEIGISKCSPKTIRNTFAVNALKADVNVKALADVMGVKTDMIIRFLDFIEVDTKQEMQKIK